MFKLIDSVPYVNMIFFDTAIVSASADITLLQKGGFITIDAATTPGGQKYASYAKDTSDSGLNVNNRKLCAPVFISRPQDDNFNPIASNGIVTFINSCVNYEGWVNADSCYDYTDDSGNSTNFPAFAAGLPLYLKYNPDSSLRSKLCVFPAATNVANVAQLTVAYALSAKDANGEAKIKWVV